MRRKKKLQANALAAIKWDEIASADKARPIKIKVDREALKFLGQPFPLPMLHAGMTLSFGVEHIGRKPKRFLAAFLGQGMWS